MRIFKKIISILSVICIIALLVYGIIAVPMIAGYKPWSIKDDSLGQDFSKNSLFYYKATDFSEIETNFAVIYSNGQDEFMGIVKSINKDAGTVDIWTSIATNAQGKNEGKVSVTVLKDSVVGMAKSMNFPFVGAYFAYINSHVAIIILMGVILALRITFIYVDPDKNSNAKKNEEESFEQKFNSVFKKDKPQTNDVNSIFTEDKPEEDVANDLPETIQTTVENEVLKPQEEVKEEVSLIKIIDKKAAPEVETKVPDANDITDYINDLAFDSKDDAWYKADQVDEALDMITAKVYSALNSENSNEKDELINSLREQNAQTEKKYLTTEAELAKAKETIENYEKQIENYKIMEQKVAKLVAAIRENKRNG